MLQTMTLPFRLTSHAKTTHADKPNSVALALEHIIYTGDNKYLPPVPLDKAGLLIQPWISCPCLAIMAKCAWELSTRASLRIYRNIRKCEGEFQTSLHERENLIGEVLVESVL